MRERVKKKKRESTRSLSNHMSNVPYMNLPASHLRGRVAIITGSRGIGRECALALARLGCACVIAARRSRRTRRCRDDLHGGRRCVPPAPRRWPARSTCATRRSRGASRTW